VLVIPNPNLETPHFEVQRLRDDEVDGDHETSYKVEIAVPEPDMISDAHGGALPQPKALVQGVTPTQPAPQQAAVAAAAPEEPAAQPAAPGEARRRSADRRGAELHRGAPGHRAAPVADLLWRPGCCQ
jgi:ribonuclease E